MKIWVSKEWYLAFKMLSGYGVVLFPTLIVTIYEAFVFRMHIVEHIFDILFYVVDLTFSDRVLGRIFSTMIVMTFPGAYLVFTPPGRRPWIAEPDMFWQSTPAKWSKRNHKDYSPFFRQQVLFLLTMNHHDQYSEGECEGIRWNELPSEVVENIIGHLAEYELDHQKEKALRFLEYSYARVKPKYMPGTPLPQLEQFEQGESVYIILQNYYNDNKNLARRWNKRKRL